MAEIKGKSKRVGKKFKKKKRIIQMHRETQALFHIWAGGM